MKILILISIKHNEIPMLAGINAATQKFQIGTAAKDEDLDYRVVHSEMSNNDIIDNIILPEIQALLRINFSLNFY